MKKEDVLIIGAVAVVGVAVIYLVTQKPKEKTPEETAAATAKAAEMKAAIAAAAVNSAAMSAISGAEATTALKSTGLRVQRITPGAMGAAKDIQAALITASGLMTVEEAAAMSGAARATAAAIGTVAAQAATEAIEAQAATLTWERQKELYRQPTTLEAIEKETWELHTTGFNNAIDSVITVSPQQEFYEDKIAYLKRLGYTRTK